jgi:uncharacterized membrane protein
MMSGWYGGLGGMHRYSGLLMLLTRVLVVAVVVWLVRALVAPKPSSRYTTTPGQMSEYEAALTLLTRRYNTGTINAVEYEQARKAIGRYS